VLQRIIDRTITPRAAAAIGALLLLPSLAGGLALDDFVHRLHARRYAFMGEARPFDMFRFMDGNPTHLAALRERGLVPWFAADDLRVAFFRPLASLLHTLDYSVLRAPPWLMHAESVAWYALLVFCAGKLYARVLGAPGVAGLAALFYAVDPGHGLPAGWLANRNAVLASVFAVMCLLAHDRWRRDGWRPGAAVSAACLALSFASGELALGALGYLAAYALTLDRGSRRARAASLAPCGLVAVAWQLVYRAGKYGVTASGFYCDPATSPLRYLRGLFVRSAELALGELLLFPVEVAARATLTAVVAAAGAAALAIFAWAATPRVRRDPRVRFFAIGALLALVPVVGVVPATRVLMLVGVGAMGVLASLVAEVTAGAERRPIVRGFVRVAGGLHVVAAPLLLVAYVLSPVAIMAVLDRCAPGLGGAGDLAGDTVVIVRTPSSLGAAYRFGVPLDDPPTPAHTLRFVAVGMGDCTVTRVDARTLDVRAPAGLLNDPLAALYRDGPPRRGDRVRLSDMELEVTEEVDGAPTAVRVRFDDPLDAPGRAWVAWDRGRFVRFAVPAVGQAATLRD
jgi:hypothetical protein